MVEETRQSYIFYEDEGDEFTRVVGREQAPICDSKVLRVSSRILTKKPIPSLNLKLVGRRQTLKPPNSGRISLLPKDVEVSSNLIEGAEGRSKKQKQKQKQIRLSRNCGVAEENSKLNETTMPILMHESEKHLNAKSMSILGTSQMKSLAGLRRIERESP